MISLLGEKLRPFVVTSQKTIYKPLKDEGLPGGPGGFVGASSLGFMNTELFIVYLNHILIPGVAENPRQHRLWKKTTARLIMDGFRSHASVEISKLLEKNHIKVLWLPPPGSHLTQSLDKVTFGIWKR